MRILYTLFLIQIIVCFYKNVVESKNVKIKLNDKTYTILYDIKKVDFSDLDILRIMHHSNHVKHCGNSVVQFLFRLLGKNLFELSYLVKHIDITYNNALTHDTSYKIIGAITYYGNTSLRISLFGVSADDNYTNGNSNIINILNKCLKNKSNENQNVNKSIEKILYDINEDEHKPIDFSNQDLSKLSETKKCILYFVTTYTLVKVNRYGTKQTISNGMREEHPAMDVEQVQQLSNILC